MAAPIPLRPDFNAPLLRKLARGSRDPHQIRRLLALAEIYDGGIRSDAARIGGVGLQIVRDWVLWFNAEGPDGLVNGRALPAFATTISARRCGRSSRTARCQPSMASCAGG